MTLLYGGKWWLEYISSRYSMINWIYISVLVEKIISCSVNAMMFLSGLFCGVFMHRILRMHDLRTKSWFSCQIILLKEIFAAIHDISRINMVAYIHQTNSLNMIYDLWSMIYDLWSMIYDLWYMIYDLWSMIYDLWSMI